MALGFGRKKAAPEPQTPEVSAAPAATPGESQGADSDLGNFDLDAFAAQLDTSPNAASSAASGSAFDFPETDAPVSNLPVSNANAANAFDLDSMFAADAPATAPSYTTEPQPLDLDSMFETESREAVAAGKIPPPTPFVPASIIDAPEPATPFYEPQVVAPKAKKKLPLVPIVGVLALLGLGGGAAMYFSGHSAPEEDTTAPVLPRRKPPKPAAPPNMAPAPAKVAPVKPAAMKTTDAKPGVVTPGIAPVSAQMSQLKMLWKQGADAKHRGDFAGARAYWQQGLKIQPTNKGFQESLAKLPK